MPRSVRRRSLPSSPAKPQQSTEPTRQLRNSTTTRTRSTEPGTQEPRDKRSHDRTVLTAVDEEDGLSIQAQPLSKDNLTHQHRTLNAPSTKKEGSNTLRLPSIRASVYNELEPVELRIESMTRYLADLDFRADEILSQISLYSSQELLARLKHRQSPDWSDFAEAAVSLERDRQYYTSDIDLLDIDWLSQRLTTRKLPSQAAELVYMKTNLALFAYRIIEEHPVELHNLLMTLASLQCFPASFVQRSAFKHQTRSPQNLDFKRRTLDLGLQVLTQCFVFQMRRNFQNKSFDATSALSEIFIDEDGNPQDVSLAGISQEEKNAYIKLIENKVSEIKDNAVQTADQEYDIARLEKKYPWRLFLIQALDWIRTRAGQLDEAIAQQGGARAIKHSLQQLKKVSTSKNNSRKPRVSRADEEFAERVTYLKGLDEFLNASNEMSQPPENERDTDQQQEIEGSNGKPEEAPNQPRSSRILREIVPESPRTDEEPRDINETRDDAQSGADEAQAINNAVEDEEVPPPAPSPPESVAIRPTQETSTVLGIISRQAKESNKENTPLEHPVGPSNHRHQGNAIETPSATDAQVRSRNKGKRPRRDSDEDDADDDEFETDTRQQKRARPHTERPAALNTNQQRQEEDDDAMFFTEVTAPAHDNRLPPSSAPASAQTRVVQTTSNLIPPSTAPVSKDTTARNHSANLSTQLRRPTPTSITSADQPPSSSYEAYRTAQSLAKSNTALASAVATSTAPFAALRPPQARRAWTSPEINRLLLLMKQYGCAWSTIKKADEDMVDPQLLERSQVQLKDKARNMKMDYLKAEMELPEEFVHVTISKAQKDLLRGLNIAVPGDEIV